MRGSLQDFLGGGGGDLADLTPAFMCRCALQVVDTALSGVPAVERNPDDDEEQEGRLCLCHQ